jgi:hypothetical protein
LARSCQTGWYDVFFSVPVVCNFSRLGENDQVSHFTTTTTTTTTPGERQKLITFPITAEKSHLLIFNSPPLAVSVGKKGSRAK